MDRKNLLNKVILMKKEPWLLKKNYGYRKRGNQFLIGTV